MTWGKQLRYAVGYLVLRCLLLVARVLPLSLLRWGFSWCGKLLLLFAKGPCEHARAHLEMAFGQGFECEKMLQALARHLGCLVGEVLWLCRASVSAILARTRFVGLEHLQQALSHNRGVVLVTGHCGNWEWMNLALQAAGIPMTAAGRRLRDPRFDRFVSRLRTRFGGEAVARGEGAAHALLRALHRGRVVGLLIDQDVAVPGVFVRFFGKPAWTPTGAAFLALRRSCPIVVGFARRDEHGVMVISLDPPLWSKGSSTEEKDIALLTATLTARIEDHIRSCPDQWVWFHRRWRRQPQPGDSVWCCSG